MTDAGTLPDLAPLHAWFASYCGSFGSRDMEAQRNYDLKELHTRNVCRDARLIARGGAPRFKMLAEVAALCHDLGRFPQYRDFRTFKDSASKNHAHLSTQVMRQNSLLDFLPEAERECVEMAVRLHNQFKVPDGLSQYTETLLKLLRDADKLDIWRVFIEYFDLPEAERASAAGLDFPDLPSCSKEVLATIGAGEMVQLSTLKSLNDFKLLQLSWVYDINSRSALELVRERAVLDRFAAILPKDAAVVDVLARVREYLDGRLDNGAGEDFPFGSWQETEDSSE
ncbi:MAG TPA: HD family phosphohydrolase [Geobacter sp.]|nr:HD family phosphohydrolase [Geobacter sp.]